MKIGKKGVSFAQLSSIALMFVLTGVSIGIGAYVLQQIGVTARFTEGTYGNMSIQNATLGLATISSWLPIIAIVIAAGVVIATLMGAFAFRSEGV